MYKEKFSYELTCDVNDILIIRIKVENKGMKMISRVVVSHMIRDYFAYIPNSLKADKGMSEFLFQLVRWRIDNLLPNEKVELICKIKANKDKELKNTLFQATYTFQYNGVSYICCKQMKLWCDNDKRNLYERFLFSPFCSINIYNSVNLIICNEVYSERIK